MPRILQFITLLLLLAPPTIVHGLLMAAPEIVSFSVNVTNSDIVFITVQDRGHGILNFTALSTNAGNTFGLIATGPETSSLQTSVAVGQRRYVLCHPFLWAQENSVLLRSDDGGLTWTNTGAGRFVHEQMPLSRRRESPMNKESELACHYDPKRGRLSSSSSLLPCRSSSFLSSNPRVAGPQQARALYKPPRCS
jgi:hypothetical protein